MLEPLLSRNVLAQMIWLQVRKAGHAKSRITTDTHLKAGPARINVLEINGSVMWD